MSKRQILVVEDDRAIRQGIVDALSFEGYATLEAKCGQDGMDLAVRRDYDLLLLDLILPKGDGLEILQAVRSARPTLPVIILTARGEEPDRVRGLKLGADDYIVKPFSIKELLARVEAVLRRTPGRPFDISQVTLPHGIVNLERLEVRFQDGERAELSQREAQLLRYLASNPGRVIGRDELLKRVWRLSPHRVDTRTIDVHIGRLREKLKDDPVAPRIIFTIRGEGYYYQAPDP